MKTVVFTPQAGHNFTPDTVAALAALGDGGTLRFAPGTYHFYPEGAHCVWLAPSNNENGVKQIAFPIFGGRNVTVDGGGSTFVFHGNIFPFAVVESAQITLCNMTLTAATLPYAPFTVGEICEEGFFLNIDRKCVPYTVDAQGHLCLLDEQNEVIFDASAEMFSLHSLERIFIRYLFTGSCTATRENLATRFIETVAEACKDGVFLRYTDNPRGIRCDFHPGERLATLPFGRKRDVIFLSEACDVMVEDVTVHRGAGMGIIAQCVHNVTVHRFRAVPVDDEPATLTADALHFVHCTGKLDIRDCEIRRTMDDMLNVHGMYTDVLAVAPGVLTVGIGHHEQSFFLPYHKGDRLRVIDRKTLATKGWLTAEDYCFTEESGRCAEVRVTECEVSFVSPGDLIEDPDRMPDLDFIGNRGYEIPRVLMAGGGRYRYADCELHGFVCALSARDVPGYWYESGRLTSLVVEHNLFDAAGSYPTFPIIEIGVAGFAPGQAPCVHGSVTLRQNRIVGADTRPICIDGVETLIEDT